MLTEKLIKYFEPLENLRVGSVKYVLCPGKWLLLNTPMKLFLLWFFSKNYIQFFVIFIIICIFSICFTYKGKVLNIICNKLRRNLGVRLAP